MPQNRSEEGKFCGAVRDRKFIRFVQCDILEGMKLAGLTSELEIL